MYLGGFTLKKIISVLICLCFIIGLYSAVYAIPKGVVTTTANIGGASAKLVYVDMSVQNRQGEAVVANQIAPSPASNLIKEVKDGNVVASMNGGFFNAYYKASSVKFPDEYPKIYGTVISNGKVLNNGNVSGPGLVFDVNGKPHIGDVNVSLRLNVNGETKSIGNANSGGDWYNDAMKSNVFVPKGKTVTYVKNGVVTGSATSSGVNISIPENTTVFLGHDELKKNDKVKVCYNVTVDNNLINADTVITCGPRLLKDGNDITNEISSSYDSKQGANTVAQRSFAAVASDGRLILGTVSSSPHNIAQYLKSIGSKNAMLFDGGASSMMYVTDKGFMTSAGRNLASVFMIVDKYKADNRIWAVPSTANVKVNSNEVHINAFTINNNNYFKLRDIAYILSKTKSAFNVGWNSEDKSITIDFADSQQYSGQGSYSKNENYISEAVKSNSKVIVNGNEVSAEVYNINGNSYFKLRDIGEWVNAEIQWDKDTSSINIIA